ncbi:MAG TPA: hypothetical protein VKA15_23900 [Isosphaeraceae bacterium]|nr:hypothetical protein [Isosphaeraceae bacterium]
MSAKGRLPHLPYVLLGAMTLVSFGGPFLIYVVVRGGSSAQWPPDRPLEWITIALVFSLVIALFFACVTIGWWYPEPRRTKGPPNR